MPEGIKWLDVGHTISLRNAYGHSGNCGAEAKLGEPYAWQAKVADGDWSTINKVCHGVLLLEATMARVAAQVLGEGLKSSEEC